MAQIVREMQREGGSVRAQERERESERGLRARLLVCLCVCVCLWVSVLNCFENNSNNFAGKMAQQQ